MGVLYLSFSNKQTENVGRSYLKINTFGNNRSIFYLHKWSIFFDISSPSWYYNVILFNLNQKATDAKHWPMRGHCCERLTNQRRVCWVPVADPDKVKTTDLALVSVIASSDLYKEPTRPDHQNSFLEVEHPRPRHLRNCNETFAINILRTIMTLWLYEYQIVRMKARTVSQWEGSIVTFRPIRGVLESENEGAQGERPLPGRSEVQEDQRPGRQLSQKN